MLNAMLGWVRAAKAPVSCSADWEQRKMIQPTSVNAVKISQAIVL